MKPSVSLTRLASSQSSARGRSAGEVITNRLPLSSPIGPRLLELPQPAGPAGGRFRQMHETPRTGVAGRAESRGDLRARTRDEKRQVEAGPPLRRRSARKPAHAAPRAPRALHDRKSGGGPCPRRRRISRPSPRTKSGASRAPSARWRRAPGPRPVRSPSAGRAGTAAPREGSSARERDQVETGRSLCERAASPRRVADLPTGTPPRHPRTSPGW